jgi:hypothetical protein
MERIERGLSYFAVVNHHLGTSFVTCDVILPDAVGKTRLFRIFKMFQENDPSWADNHCSHVTALGESNTRILNLCHKSGLSDTNLVPS